ncbi:ABC transporter permease [Streptococcus sp. ZJ93]|uniref:ABC transporter permease n=1 Tax=Streptococcus handemini TaxID=3161188 RepID=UPI0032ED1CDC
MNYIKFLFSKVLKNKLTWASYLVVLFLSLVVLFLNSRNRNNDILKSDVKATVLQMGLYVEQLERDKNAEGLSSEEKEKISQDLSDGKEQLAKEKEFLKAINSGDWAVVYAEQVNHLSKAVETLEKNGADEAAIQGFKEGLLYYQALSDKNYPFENMTFPTQTIGFLQNLTIYYLPFLVTIMLVFVVSNLFGSIYRDKIDTFQILPIKMSTRVIREVGIVTLLGIVLPALLLAVLGTVSSLLFGVGNPDYPIKFHMEGTEDIYFSAIGQTILPSLGLFLLASCFVALFTYLIMCLVKNQMLGLFISLLVSLGAVLLPQFVVPLQPLAHLIPTTYMSSFMVTTGQTAYGLNNTQITSQQGYLTLGVGIAFMIASALFVGRKKLILCLDKTTFVTV